MTIWKCYWHALEQRCLFRFLPITAPSSFFCRINPKLIKASSRREREEIRLLFRVEIISDWEFYFRQGSQYKCAWIAWPHSNSSWKNLKGEGSHLKGIPAISKLPFFSPAAGRGQIWEKCSHAELPFRSRIIRGAPNLIQWESVSVMSWLYCIWIPDTQSATKRSFSAPRRRCRRWLLCPSQ